MTQHTPTPFRMLPEGEHCILGNDDTIVCGIFTCCAREQMLANAEFIVRACNCHDDMLAFIEKVAEMDLANFVPDIQAEAVALIKKLY